MKIDIVVPVFNEETRLVQRLPDLHRFITASISDSWRILIANNGSNDNTQAIAERFSREFVNTDVLSIRQKGRGGALKQAWLKSQADVLTYMDVDLATELDAFPALVNEIMVNGADLAIGSRFHPGSKTTRGWKREIVSRGYLRLAKTLCGIHCSDLQCGFKAISRHAAQALLPATKDNGWFFDTELLVLAELCGYKIAEIPVRWREDPDTRVRILSTALKDVQGLLRLRFKFRALKNSVRESPNPSRSSVHGSCC